MIAAGTRVSVVVPCRNESRHIMQLLDALRTQTRVPDEVIIVDHSSDATADVVARYAGAHPDLAIRLLPVDKASIPASVNAGVAQAEGDVIVRLDGHAIPDVDYVERAVAALGAGADIGVAGGVWLVAPGADTRTAEAIARAVSHPVGAGDAAYRISAGSPSRRDVDTVPFGCYRKALWSELGGLNEQLLSNEDYEFNYRVRASGRRVVLDTAVRCTYFARATLGALATQYFRYGWWKVAMLRRYPASLRWRQAVPAAFVATLIGLLMLSGFSLVALAALAGVLMLYAGLIVLASIDVCRKAGSWRTLTKLVAAFATIHLCWGAGALVNLATCGRWPFGPDSVAVR
ncbi:MAG: glycosyltransferase family 2 protein [Acidobacteriota bacterium]